jgi:outer membrane lipopolysaccharide assembly protein LptE/RlpB
MNPMKRSMVNAIDKTGAALFLFLFLCLAWLPGCGYHFRAVGEPVGIEISSLAIPMIESTSSRLGFEGEFTKVIREEFISRANIPLVSEDKAAMVLIAKVYDIKTDPLSYAITQNSVRGETVNYEETNARWLRIQMEARLVERATGKVIWEDKDLAEKASFSVGTDPLTNRYNERKAVSQIAKNLARRLYLQTMERF